MKTTIQVHSKKIVVRFKKGLLTKAMLQKHKAKEGCYDINTWIIKQQKKDPSRGNNELIG